MREPLRAIFTDGISPTVLDLLRAREQGLGVRVELAGMDEIGALPSAPNLLIVKRCHLALRDVLSVPRLLGLQKLGVVTDNFEEHELRAAGIKVRTMVLPSALTVADHAIALILALVRRLHDGEEAMHRPAHRAPTRTSETDIAYNWAKLRTRPLAGLKLGLVGFGEIALQVARRAQAFGLMVAYTKRRPLPSNLERRFGVRYRPLDELFRQSDIVSLHLPHSSETHQLINRDRLLTMKADAILINTARGGLIDEKALFEVMDGGHLAGAGLDTFNEEPLPNNSPLLRLRNAVLTPHLAGAGPEAFADQLGVTLRKWVKEANQVRVPS